MTKSKLSSIILAVFCCTLWGIQFPAIKIMYSGFSVQSAELGRLVYFAGIRFFFAGILLLAVDIISGGTPFKYLTKRNIPGLAGLGLVMTGIQYSAYNMSMMWLTGGIGSLLNSTNAFFSVILAHFFSSDDKITVHKIAGCVLGLCGIAVLCLDGNSSASVLGVVVMIISALAFSFGNVINKKVAVYVPAKSLAGWQMLFGGTVLVILGRLLGGYIGSGTVLAWLCLLYSVMTASVTYTLWSRLLLNGNVSSIGVYTSLIPVIGVIASSFLPGEPGITLTVIISLALVIIGVILVNKVSD